MSACSPARKRPLSWQAAVTSARVRPWRNTIRPAAIFARSWPGSGSRTSNSSWPGARVPAPRVKRQSRSSAPPSGRPQLPRQPSPHDGSPALSRRGAPSCELASQALDFDHDFWASCTMTFMLYNAPQSTCSQRVRFVLNAKTIPFDEIKLDLLAGDQLKPDYLALNPNGVVPTLDHNGAIIIDSSVIIEYLDEIAPERTKFTPENPVLRARMRALMHFIDEMAAAAVRVPTFNLAFLPRFAAMSEEAFKAFAESKPLRREFMLAMGRTGFPQKDMDEALARLRRTYERMDAEIAKSGGPWLLGADISLADVMLMPAIVRMADLGRAGDWRDLPRVERWYEAIAAHPAFAPTYYPGSLLTERFPHLRETGLSRPVSQD